MEFYRLWAPRGYDRVTQLFEVHFFDHSHIFRCIPRFICQFGITYASDPAVRQFMEWEAAIPDDPMPDDVQFERGTIAFAGALVTAAHGLFLGALVSHVVFGPPQVAARILARPKYSFPSGTSHVRLCVLHSFCDCDLYSLTVDVCRKIDTLGDEPWESPIGKVTEGMEYVEQWYSYHHKGGEEPDQEDIE